MASENAIRDQNFVTSGLAVLNTDSVQGANKIRVKIDSDSMKVTLTASIGFTMVPIDAEDENYVDCLTFVGSDGLVYPWVATASGAVLIAL